MASQYDFKKEWPKIKQELFRVSQEAVKLAKKGEEELKKISHKGRLHVDSTALSLKKEHLYHLIGKEYVAAKCPSAQTPKIKKLVEEVKSIDKQIKDLRKKIGGKQVVKKKAVRKKTVKKK